MNAKMYIDGKWVNAGSEEVFQDFNPATGEMLGTAPRGDRSDVTRAIEAARNKQDKIANMTVFERLKLLSRVSEQIADNVEDLAILEAKETGRPIKESIDEVRYTAEAIKSYGESVKRLFGEIRPSTKKNKRILVWREPVGVTGIISPFVFPWDIMGVNVAGAIACGNSVVAKPSSSSPLVALKLAEMFERAGCPAGVFNVVTGPGPVVGNEMIKNPGIDMIIFTGTTETWEKAGKDLDSLKRRYIALGAKNPLIICEDAEMKRAVNVTVLAACSNCGQTPNGLGRLIVHEKIYDKFLNQLINKVKDLKVGNPVDPQTDVGPIIDEKRAKHVERLVNEAVEKGAKILVGGKRFRKNWFKPTVIDNVSGDMRIAQVETFGPVIPITKYSTVDEAVDIANESKYGLRGGAITTDLRKGFYFAENLHLGTFVMNEGPYQWEVFEAYGGVKRSGINRAAYERIFTFTEQKTVVIDYGT